jgi:hypothetical protein
VLRTGRAPARRILIVLGLLLAFTSALALNWTIQTVAFPDYRQAVSTADALRELGFDSYIEFTMSGDGRQFARVRIGCFTDRHGAELFARSLRGAITEQAVVQPLNAGAEVSFCLRSEVGFVKPGSWQIERQNDQEILFRVAVAGHTGFIRRADGQWQLLPEALEPRSDSGSGTGPFRQAELSGVALTVARIAGNDRVVCPGSLLWQNGAVAVVERANSVIACVIEEDYRQFLP